MLAHIVGAPVEETALSLAPVVLAAAGMASARLREIVTVRRSAALANGRRHDSRRSA